MRVQRACDTLDHDHGALQQDQFGPGFHAEAFRDFKEIGQQPRHRYPARLHPENRLAHCPKGAGKFVNVAVWGDIARLEMHFGDAAVILADKAHKDLGIDPARVFVDPAHDAEVKGDDVTVRRDLQVALVHVGMEEPIPQRVVQEQLQHPCAQNPAIMARRIDQGVVVQPDPFGPTQRHHVAAGQGPDRLGHLKAFVLDRVRRKFGGGRAFQPQVKFARDHAFEMGNHVNRAQAAGKRGQPFDPAGRQIEGVNILAEGAFDPRTQDLDRDILTGIGQPRAVDLRDRRRRDGLGEL